MATREEKLNVLKSVDKLDDKQIEALYKLYQDVVKKQEEEKKNILEELDKNTAKKYKIGLKIVNKILENIGKSQIQDLTEFKHIERVDLLKQENKDVLLEMDDEIFSLFDKIKCAYYRKTDNYVLNFLRGMCKELDLKLTSHKKDLYKNNYRYTHTYYSIKNI